MVPDPDEGAPEDDGEGDQTPDEGVLRESGAEPREAEPQKPESQKPEPSKAEP